MSRLITAGLTILFVLVPISALAGSLIWENEFVDEQSISGASITSQDVQVDISTTVVTDNDTAADLVPFGSEANFFSFEAGTQGAHTGYGFVGFNNVGDDPADYLEITFSFASLVTDLMFSLVDIDQRAQGGASDFDDGIIVTYNGTVDGGGVNIVSFPAFYTLHPNNAVADEPFTGFEGEPAAGTNDGTPSSSADANIDFDFGSTVIDSVTIRYFSTDDAPANPSGQLLGITDMSWTPVPEPGTGWLVTLGLMAMATGRHTRRS